MLEAPEQTKIHFLFSQKYFSYIWMNYTQSLQIPFRSLILIKIIPIGLNAFPQNTCDKIPLLEVC